jgi:hypothetical protein
MDIDELKRYIIETFDGVRAADGVGDTFFYYAPDGGRHFARQIPFATIVTGDHYDSVSGLDRPGTFRLNIGLSEDMYSTVFASAPARPDEHGGFDYTVPDIVLPHPAYASHHWVCVVNPGAKTMGTVRELLADAYRLVSGKVNGE